MIMNKVREMLKQLKKNMKLALLKKGHADVPALGVNLSA
jgi:hypothetical protein